MVDANKLAQIVADARMNVHLTLAELAVQIKQSEARGNNAMTRALRAALDSATREYVMLSNMLDDANPELTANDG